MAETKNYFTELYNIDMSGKVEKKNGLNYVSWAAAWSEVKKHHPDATYAIYENENGRFWFDDSRTGWVKTGVTINDVEHIERLPIMDYRNQSIPADKITSVDANKTVQRSLTKACGRHGVGLYVYEGEDLPEEVKIQEELEKQKKKEELNDIIKKIKDKVSELKKAEVTPEEVKTAITSAGSPANYNKIEDVTVAEKVLENLNKLGGNA